MAKLSLEDLDLAGKRVFMRVDFNVPLDNAGEQAKVAADTRIKAALPSIQYVLGRRGRLVLASHLGRPKGKVDARYSLRPVVARLGELLGRDVPLAGDSTGPAVRAVVDSLAAGDLIV